MTVVDIAYRVTWDVYPLHPFLKVNLPSSYNFKVVVSGVHKAVKVSARGVTNNHSLLMCNGIQNVLLNLRNLYSHTSGTLTVDGCSRVDSHSTSGT
jgi:hypothetical protein